MLILLIKLQKNCAFAYNITEHSTNEQRRVHDNMMEKKLEEGESHDANEETGEKKEEIIIAFSCLVLKVEKHSRHCTVL